MPTWRATQRMRLFVKHQIMHLSDLLPNRHPCCSRKEGRQIVLQIRREPLCTMPESPLNWKSIPIHLKPQRLLRANILKGRANWPSWAAIDRFGKCCKGAGDRAQRASYLAGARSFALTRSAAASSRSEERRVGKERRY